jgi:hypothetical protein
MTRFRIRLPQRLGVALGRTRISAVRLSRRGDPAGHDVWSRDITDLASDFAALRNDLEIGSGRLHIALLPPLVQVRRIELPRLGEDSVRQVLARDAARYFPGAGGPQVIGVTCLGQGRRSPLPYLVAAADAPMVDSIFEATEHAGFTIDSLLPAHSAWEAGARLLWPELRRDEASLVIVGEDRVDAIGLYKGRLSLVRRFPLSTDPSLVATSLAEPGTELRCGVIGPAERRVPIVTELESRGVRVLSASGSQPLIQSPERFAALMAGRARGPVLLPDRARLERERRARRLSARLLSGAAALLVFAAGVELWGAHRELASVESRRAALRANVANAMVVRDEMSQLDERLGALAAAETGRSRWAATLVSVAEYLPKDAHLVGFRGSADSVVMEGEAQRAGLVFESLQKAPGVLGVRADAPIRQEARDSGPAIERFTLAAVIASGQGPRGDPEASRAAAAGLLRVRGAPSQ